MSVAERVAKGTDFLDKVDPHWWKAIEVSDLLMASETVCVLGQRYGSFRRGKELLGLNGNAPDLGFHVHEGEHLLVAPLGQAWTGVVSGRQQSMNLFSRIATELRRGWRRFNSQRGPVGD